MRTYEFAVGEGVYRVEAVVTTTEAGIVATVCTAEHSHVGAVVVATPDGAEPTCVLLPEHRDDVPARQMATALAARFGMPASVTCGLHIDNATREQIQALVDNAAQLTAAVIAGLAEGGDAIAPSLPAKTVPKPAQNSA